MQWCQKGIDLLCPIQSQSAYTFFAESPCLWLSSTFSAIFRHPLDRLSLKQRANALF